MKTTKPTSTISFNTKPFLLGVLRRLVENDVLTFWALIQHEPEEDESKTHFHVYMEPAKQVDTLWLRKQFIEPDLHNPEHPRGTLPMEKSDFANWYWYGLHDKAYLASKNQIRKYHYEPSSVLTNDDDYLAEKVRRNPNPKAELLKVVDLVQKGYNPMEIAVAMNVPLRNLQYFINGLSLINTPEVTYRGLSLPHQEEYDPDDDFVKTIDQFGEIE